MFRYPTPFSALTLFKKEHYEKKKKIQSHARYFFASSLSSPSSKTIPSSEPHISSLPHNDNGWEIDDVELDHESDQQDLDPLLRQQLEQENQSLILQYQDTQKEVEYGFCCFHLSL